MAADVEKAAEYTIVAIVAVLLMALLASISLGGSASVDPVTDSNVTVESRPDVPGSVDVSATREYAASFPDEGGYVDTPAVGNGSLTVCGSAELASDANTAATYTVWAGKNGTRALHYDSGVWLWYVANETTGTSETVTLPAPSPSDALTQVCGRYNASAQTVTMSREESVSATLALTSETEDRNVSREWYGRIDEVRRFGGAVDDATLTAYGDDPIQPLPSAPRDGRLLFDEGSGSTSHVYFDGSDATLVNVGWTAGLSDVSLDRGTDYELHGSPFSLRVLSGGYLEGAPVVFVDWALVGLGSMIIEFVGVLLGVSALWYIMREAGVI